MLYAAVTVYSLIMAVAAVAGSGDLLASLSILATLVVGFVGAWAVIRAGHVDNRVTGGPEEPSIEELRATVERQDKANDALGAQIQRQARRLTYQKGQLTSYKTALEQCEERENKLRGELRQKGVL